MASKRSNFAIANLPTASVTVHLNRSVALSVSPLGRSPTSNSLRIGKADCSTAASMAGP